MTDTVDCIKRRSLSLRTVTVRDDPDENGLGQYS